MPESDRDEARFDPDDPAVWKNAAQNKIRAAALVDRVYPVTYRAQVWNRANPHSPIGSQPIEEMSPTEICVRLPVPWQWEFVTDVARHVVQV